MVQKKTRFPKGISFFGKIFLSVRRKELWQHCWKKFAKRPRFIRSVSGSEGKISDFFSKKIFSIKIFPLAHRMFSQPRWKFFPLKFELFLLNIRKLSQKFRLFSNFLFIKVSQWRHRMGYWQHWPKKFAERSKVLALKIRLRWKNLIFFSISPSWSNCSYGHTKWSFD